MAVCLICSNDVFRSLPMDDKELLLQVARQVIDGILSGAKNRLGITPSRPGVCLVERCARFVEASCGGCRSCSRCAIADELRAAEDQLHADRDAELAQIGFNERDLDGLINQFVDGLCTNHVTFGSVLAEEWYGRRSFSAAP